MGYFAGLTVAMVFLTACAGQTSSRNSPDAACTVTAGNHSAGAEGVPVDADWRTKLGPGKELTATPSTIAAGARGQRLTVSGTVYDSRCRPLAGAALDAWQVTADGVYGPDNGAGGMRCCYLTGHVRTDPHGRYELATVMPGHYMSGAAHVHIAVSGPAGGQLLTEIQFAGDHALGSRDQVNVLPLAEEVGGGLHAVFDIVLAAL